MVSVFFNCEQDVETLSSRHAMKYSDVNFDFSHVLDSCKDHRGGVCFVKVMNSSTRPVVDAPGLNTIVRLRAGVRVRVMAPVAQD